MYRLALVALFAAAGLAPAQDWAKAKLAKSSRHGEWVKIKHGSREVEAWVVYPEVKDKATSVVVIHEIFGLTDWVRNTADQFAEHGYIAIAPDLLSGMAPKGGGSAELGDGVMRVIRGLPLEQITADLNATADYVSKLPAANGKVVVTGFCWGGGQTFRYATNNKTIKAAFPFYGSGPEKADEIAKIDCPVYGFYGGNDARVGATVPKSKELMKAAGKTYEPTTYEGAGHGFMRLAEDPTAKESDKAANKKAREAAWKRMLEILKKV